MEPLTPRRKALHGAAQDARARYEKSLATLRARLSALPTTVEKFGLHDKRLEQLEVRIMALRKDLQGILAMDLNRNSISPLRAGTKDGEQVPRRQAERSSRFEQGYKALDVVNQLCELTQSELESTAAGGTMPSGADRRCSRSVTFREHSSAQVFERESRNGDALTELPHILTSADIEMKPQAAPQAASGLPLTARRRSSILSGTSVADHGLGDFLTELGGRITELETAGGLGTLECVLVEPLGKRLLASSFVSTGLVICLHGMPPDPEVLEEWAQAMKLAGWLDIGISVAVPNVQMSSALQQPDLEAVIEATLSLCNVGQCIICGKSWGALRAIELAKSERVGEKVEGLILVAPSSPPPDGCSNVKVPVLILWGEDDPVESFDEEAEAWIEELDGRDQPTSMEVTIGGHRFDRLLADRAVATALRNFTVSSLLISDLENTAPRDGASISASTAAATGEMVLSERAHCLTGALPGFILAGEESEADEDEEEDEVNHETRESVVSTDARRSVKRLSAILPQWLNAGMPMASE